MQPKAYDDNSTEDNNHTNSRENRSGLVSRNVTVAGHRTSIRLEPDMWTALSEICKRERVTMHEVCTAVSRRKGQDSSLTAAIRVFIMAYFRAAATDDGHMRAGHGTGMPFGIVPNMVTPATSPAQVSPAPTPAIPYPAGQALNQSTSMSMKIGRY